MTRGLLALASLATIAVALWLLAVSVTILPTRDPAHVAMWRGIALAFLAYASLCGAWLAAGGRAAWLRPAMRLASLSAIAGGGYLLYAMSTAREGRFEGYLLVIGALLVVHGVAGVLGTARGAASARGIAARADR